MTPETTDFIEFPKIARYSRDVVVTEKIDGTNGCVFIEESGMVMKVGSRTRWLSDSEDNFGFYKWCMTHREELLALGPGRHFGEWWGSGIQRNYGLNEKRFSLFNVQRWCSYGTIPAQIPCGDPRIVKMQTTLPECVGLVPVLWKGAFDILPLEALMRHLIEGGSQAAPGFMKPEGLVIHHIQGKTSFKKTIEKDSEPKSLSV